METLLKDKRINTALLILIIIISIFTFAKFVNEVKESKYIGRENQPINTISVSGEGEVLAVSDIASIYINLKGEGKTSKKAQFLLNKTITKVLEYLDNKNIDKKDVKSEYGGLNPKYSYEEVVCFAYPCPRQEQKITGYTASQSITIKIRIVDDASDIRTGLADLGITNISGPNFSIDDDDFFKDEARSLAIKDARAKAKLLSEELGVSLGSVVSFSENKNGNYPIMYQSKNMIESASIDTASAPILPKGENRISSYVTITYEIR